MQASSAFFEWIGLSEEALSRYTESGHVFDANGKIKGFGPDHFQPVKKVAKQTSRYE